MNSNISMIEFLTLKILESNPQRGIDVQKKLYEAKIIKGYKSGYCSIYKLAKKGLCKSNNNYWEITPEGKNLLKELNI